MRTLRLPQVEAKVGLKRSTIYAMAKQGEFPSPVKLGARASAWIESQVDDWLKQKLRASQPS